MSKKDIKLTPEEQAMAEDFEKLAAADKEAEAQATVYFDEGEPARFKTGGAPASEIAAYREVHGTPAYAVVEGVVPLGMAEPKTVRLEDGEQAPE